MRIGFVGAGGLGEPMVERMLAAGHAVRVHARRPEVRSRLAALGAVVTDDVGSAATGADAFVSCLFSDAQLAEVGPQVVDALPDGAVFASHTTGSTALLVGLADRGRPRGVAVVDAPVSGTDEDVRGGRLTVLLGGEAAAVATCTRAVSAYAGAVVPTGPLGSALALKLVNNLLFAAQVQLGAAAVQLAAELGAAPAQVFEAFAHMSGGSTALLHMAAGGDVEQFGRRIAPFLAKDVAACEDAARELGVQPDLLLEVARRGPLDLTAER